MPSPRAGLVPLLLLLAACFGAPTEADTSNVVVETTGNANASRLQVRAGETTLWVDGALARRTEGDHEVLTLRGRTSRNLVDGRGFVLDDPYGAWTKASARTFALTWATSELTTLITGVNQFIGLQLSHSATRPDGLTARIVVRPRLEAFTGSGVYFVSKVLPVVSGGRTVFRVKGSTATHIYGLRADAGDVALTDVRVLDDTHFQIDLLADHVIALAGSGARLSVAVDLPAGTSRKSAALGLVIERLGLTTDDAYDVWPRPTCTDDVRACLAALPPGTLDLGACGEALPVLACQGQVGAVVDDVAFQAALARADTLLADPAGFAADVSALVGAERAAAYTEAVHQSLEGRLEQQVGRWYSDEAARDAALVAEVDAGLDAAYARPYDLIEPWEPLPGDLARNRQVAADTLLAWLASHDLRNTEWGRSLEVLARQYRDRHVASLRAFREEAVPEGAPDAPEDTFIGDWLGALVEIRIDRATGQSAGILFEID